ncbi:LOW QUALITY PROTEIN: GRB2-associated-binding protein 2 [Tachyglossus aculeatus]|uniref:LOW QUALITY PROTEIN: GRB2-associated-binding protein 2 n=1 Tax=Tachyglossus aculeatus TaxID=9261 RepID=UPI0018F6101E|nr:LOW QUALITY PROTEIN: GRB2-associated-binding protein 2 [Tachyglossus aculeatus]
MSGGEVVCAGWLRKSPPEKKLRRYAWKKRWFVLRSGRMSGDPDVLEYYKNDRSKRPLRVINLSLCEQVDAGLAFSKKELQDSFVFDLKTGERTFYLVAETEEEMSQWVQSICQICGFNQAEENADAPWNARAGPRASPSPAAAAAAEVSGAWCHQAAFPLPERNCSGPAVHSSQPALCTLDAGPAPAQAPLSTSAPQDYLFLHQCVSRRAENTRSASFSQGTRSSCFVRGDGAGRKPAQGNGHCVNGAGGPAHGFYSLPKPSRHRSDLRDGSCHLPRRLGSSSGPPDSDPEEGSAHQAAGLALGRVLRDLALDSPEGPATPLSTYQIPRTFALDKSPPPRPPKPGQAESPRRGSPQQRPRDGGRTVSAATTIPRRNTLPAVDNSRLHRASSCEMCEHPQPGPGSGSVGRSVESVDEGFSSYLRAKAALGRSDSGASEDNYVPMNPGSASLLQADRGTDGPQGLYIPMSPGPHHLDLLGFSGSGAVPGRRPSGPAGGGEVQPPPVNRNLKPDRKAKPTPLDLRNNAIIDELPFKSPVTRSWSRPTQTFTWGCSQACRPVSSQSVTSTDSGDSEENYVPMQNPASASPVPHGASSPSHKKSTGSVDYLALDFQPGSPSPHRKPSTSSVTSDEKVDYVQVDKEKTQALQSTMQEWTDVRQSFEPGKGAKP